MIVTVDKSSPIYITIWVEFLSALGALALIVYGFIKKLRLSYLIYCVLGFFLATITGSFSSLPRYIIVLFPLFILFGRMLAEPKRSDRWGLVLMFVVILATETALFVRGYWVG